LRQAYEQNYQQNLDYFKSTFLRNNADVLSINTEQPYLTPLIKFFKERRS
jgi:hypothetical protein